MITRVPPHRPSADSPRECRLRAGVRVRTRVVSWDSGGGGGSTFSPALLRQAREAIPNLQTAMGVGYGQTECAALATINAGEELVARKAVIEFLVHKQAHVESK